MTTAIMRSTQIQFNLTLNVNIDTDKTLLLIAGLIALVAFYVARAGRELLLWWTDVTEAARFVSQVYVIGLKALAWGFMGMRL